MTVPFWLLVLAVVVAWIVLATLVGIGLGKVIRRRNQQVPPRLRVVPEPATKENDHAGHDSYTWHDGPPPPNSHTVFERGAARTATAPHVGGTSDARKATHV